MTYDSSLATTRDRIRLITGDTSNNAQTEYFPDATYDASIAEYDPWQLAAAEMAEAVAVKIEQDPSSFTAVGDMSVSWSDRTRSLRAAAVRLRQEAAAASVGAITSVALTREGSASAEYRAEQYRRLWRG